MPQTADFDVNEFTPSAQSAADEQLLVKFFVKPRPDDVATRAEGRPIFKDVEYVDIKIPGSRTGGACRPASHADKLRFARHYAAFQQRIETPTEGTPLAEWPLVTRSQAEEMAFHNIKTVEHLAELSDTHAGNFMGIHALKVKAKAWLEKAGDDAEVANLQAQLAERDERLAALEAKMEQMLSPQPTDEKLAPEPETPSLASDLDNVDEVAPAPVKKRRRRKKVTTDGAVQISD